VIPTSVGDTSDGGDDGGDDNGDDGSDSGDDNAVSISGAQTSVDSLSANSLSALADLSRLYAQAVGSSDPQFLAKAKKSSDKDKKAADKKDADKKSDDAAKDDKTEAAKPPEPPKADDKKDEKKPDAASSDDKTKGPGRTATLWTLKSKAQFERGDGDGISVTSDGDVRLAPVMKRALLLDQDAQVWSYLPDGKGGAYIGTGSDGKIYRLDDKNAVVQTIETKELAIRALAEDSHGTIYAGGWPTGTIYKVADGKAESFAKVDAEYVMALLTDSSDNLYAAVGPDGRILKIDPTGKSSVFFKADEPHIVSIAKDADGNLIAGTSDPGTVYRVKPDGKASVLFDPQDKAVTALWIDPKGVLYAATSPNGRILKIVPNEMPRLLYEAKAPIMALTGGPGGDLYAGAGADVIRITPDEAVSRLDNDDQDQILGLNWSSPDELQAISGNLAAVYTADRRAKEGEYLSPVRDTETPSQWGHISWLADIPEGAKLQLATRSGNTQEPDNTWSSWSWAYNDASGSTITSPPGRYLQFRASMTAGGDDKSPVLKSVTLSYLTENRPPSVKITAPSVADTWSGKQTIRWNASDPDKDTLTYDVYYSSDNGQTWKPLKTEGKTETTAAAPSTGGATETPKETEKPKPTGPSAQDVMNQINSELDKDKTLSTSDRAMLDALLPTLVDDAVSTPPDKEMKPDPAPAGAPPLKPLSTTNFSWDTEQIPDGDYLVKVVASDKRSNPTDAQSDQDIIGPITILNDKPVVTIDDHDTEVKDRAVTIKGSANGGKASLSTVSYRVDGGEWAAAESKDGFFDAPKEDFVITTESLSPGDHTIEVRATTTANANGATTTKVTVK
jgi:hypothetical protein